MNATNVTSIRSVNEVKTNEKVSDATTTQKVQTSEKNTTSTSSYPYNTLPPAGNSGGLFLTSMGVSLLTFVIFKVCKKALGRRLYG